MPYTRVCGAGRDSGSRVSGFAAIAAHVHRPYATLEAMHVDNPATSADAAKIFPFDLGRHWVTITFVTTTVPRTPVTAGDHWNKPAYDVRRSGTATRQGQTTSRLRRRSSLRHRTEGSTYPVALLALEAHDQDDR